MRSPSSLTLLILFTLTAALVAQDARVEFEVVSIKRHAENDRTANMRTEPDGTTRIINQPILAVLGRVSPVPPRDILGLPEWVRTERYDIIAKPPEGATTPDQMRPMWGTMFADRLKLTAHTEQRERDVYLLERAREDGKLGPQITPSTLDCSGPQPPLAATGPPSRIEDLKQRCILVATGSSLVSGGVTMKALAAFLAGPAGGAVEDQTGLPGWYAFELRFARLPRAAAPGAEANASDDLPDVFTAVQEQLGLKLQHEKKTMPVWIVDHIERPSEN